MNNNREIRRKFHREIFYSEKSMGLIVHLNADW